MNANSTIKRIMRETQEIKQDASPDYTASPLEDNIFEWHFTIRGAQETEFEGGIYHGRIILPPDYPFKPPNIVLLTPNGRFQVDVKICLSISAHHPETWQPSWSIRTVLVALIGFMSTEGKGAVGALDYPVSERKVLALQSVDWKCSKCGSHNRTALPEPPKCKESTTTDATTVETTTTTTTTTETPTSTNSAENNSFSSENLGHVDNENNNLSDNIDEIDNINDISNNNNNNSEEIVKEHQNDVSSTSELTKRNVQQQQPNPTNTNLVDQMPTNNNVSNNNNSTTPPRPIQATFVRNNTTITTPVTRIESITRPSTTNIDRLIVFVFILLMAFVFKKLFY